jgi:hypothetical protein
MTALGLSCLALALAIFPVRPASVTLWLTSRPLPAGARVVSSDLTPVLVLAGSTLPQGALSYAPVGWHLVRALPSHAVICADSVTRLPLPQAPLPTQLVVTIPVPVVPAGLAAKGAVMLLLNSTPPQVLVPRATVSSVSSTAQGSFVAVGLSEAQAEVVEFAVSSGKVVVLPWLP